MNADQGMSMIGQGGVIPHCEFFCDKCFAEWDERRGNKRTKEGQTCGAMNRPDNKPCDGILKVKKTA